ncbi:MAG: amino acid racemase [Betaproteobacteria bacterium]|nr:amino acid racemase [Betaproteobacteria bacterium]
MKTAGIIGGIAPESTIQYYRQAVAEYQRLTDESEFPSIIINSIHMTKMLSLIGQNKLSEVTDYLLSEIIKLHKAGADFAVMASNTPHVVFNELQRQTPIPLISIIEVACDAAKSGNLKKVGVLGTRFTMQGTAYPNTFSKFSIEVVAPNPNEQEFIHNIYMNELVKGILLPDTKQKLNEIIEAMITRENIDGVVLAGTELPLILTEPSHKGIPFLDTTKLHVQRIVETILK